MISQTCGASILLFKGLSLSFLTRKSSEYLARGKVKVLTIPPCVSLSKGVSQMEVEVVWGPSGAQLMLLHRPNQRAPHIISPCHNTLPLSKTNSHFSSLLLE